MPLSAWLLIAAGAGAITGLETWAWIRHQVSMIGIAAAWAVGIAVVIGVGYVLLSGGSSTAAGSGDEPSAGACDPNYSGGCVPDTGGDVDCGEISDTNLSVVGDDVDGLDRDGDGVACEG
jgi:hypothetical protein